MRSVVAATFLLTAWTAVAAAQTTRNRPVCTADQAGEILVTTITYGDGYRVDAPWRVTGERKLRAGAARVTAVLDHIIETNPHTRKRQVTALPSVVELTFRGDNRRAILRDAADVWCATVGKAMAERSSQAVSRVAERRQVM